MQFAPTNDEQFLLSDLPPEERFNYAIPRICECEEVWSLGEEEGWLVRYVDDKPVISIWPYNKMALENIADDYSNCRAIAVSLEHFLYKVLTQCRDGEINIDVCPAPGQPGYTLSADRLYELLEGMVESETYFLEG
jgi:hypothetical protein